MDYGFAHDGRVYTPNGSDVAVEDNEARNQQIAEAELAHWATQPPKAIGYFDAKKGVVTLWDSQVIGHITSYNIYRHNFGYRMISLRVKGTNGAEYYGRASYDWGQVVKLHKAK